MTSNEYIKYNIAPIVIGLGVLYPILSSIDNARESNKVVEVVEVEKCTPQVFSGAPSFNYPYTEIKSENPSANNYHEVTEEMVASSVTASDFKLTVKQKIKINTEMEKTHGLPSGLLTAQHHTETSGNCDAISSKGAMGCFQFTKQTIEELRRVKGLKFDPYDYKESANAASVYMKILYDRVNKGSSASEEAKWALALAGYNAGPGNVKKQKWDELTKHSKHYSEVSSKITFKETREYIDKIASKIYGKKHVVKKGDSLYTIAKKHNTSVDNLVASLGTSKIYPNQVIVIN